MPIIYILTNESMPDMVKIGYTDNLVERMKSLNSPAGIPLPFECFYAVYVEQEEVTQDVEKRIHDGLDDYRVNPRREFFNILPDNAKSILKIVESMGGKNVTPTEDITDTTQDKDSIEKARSRRTNFKFTMLGIESGETLTFKKNRFITCEVVNETQVKFRGETMSLSESALKVLRDMGYDWGTTNGTMWWCLNGNTLDSLRRDTKN